MKIIENSVFVINRDWKFKQVIQYLYLIFLDKLYKLLFLIFPTKYSLKKYTISICAIFKNEAPYMREW